MHVKGKCFSVTVLIHWFFLAASERCTVNLGNTNFHWHASGHKKSLETISFGTNNCRNGNISLLVKF